MTFVQNIWIYTIVDTDYSLCTFVAFDFGAEHEEQDSLSERKDGCEMRDLRAN